MSALGGVSFEIAENEWHVSSSGIEFDDTLFSATLQELAFAEMFETVYEPLLRDGIRVGETRLVPHGFSAAGDYLVVELAAIPAGSSPAPVREPEPPARSSRLDPVRP